MDILLAVPCPCRVGFQNYLGYLEAPEFIYIDTEDKSVPTIVGSGLEDYFNGGWYFREGEILWRVAWSSYKGSAPFDGEYVSLS